MDLINYALDIAKNQFKFPDLRIGAEDITSCQKGKASAFINQVRKYAVANAPQKPAPPKGAKTRRHSSATAKDLFIQSRIKSTSQEDIVEWINKKLEGKKSPIKSLDDPRLNSIFLIEFLAQLMPEHADASLISTANTEEAQIMNASLLLSIVWRLGLLVPIHPKNFVIPSPSAIKTFCSSLLVHFNVMNKMINIS